MFRFEQLDIWRLSIEYGKNCYDLTKQFLEYERYGLSDQLRRASVSISNNIVEGSTGSNRNFTSYLERAIGSALETVNIIYFAVYLGYLKQNDFETLYLQAESLIKKIRSFKKTLYGKEN